MARLNFGTMQENNKSRLEKIDVKEVAYLLSIGAIEPDYVRTLMDRSENKDVQDQLAELLKIEETFTMSFNFEPSVNVEQNEISDTASCSTEQCFKSVSNINTNIEKASLLTKDCKPFDEEVDFEESMIPSPVPNIIEDMPPDNYATTTTEKCFKQFQDKNIDSSTLLQMNEINSYENNAPDVSFYKGPVIYERLQYELPNPVSEIQHTITPKNKEGYHFRIVRDFSKFLKSYEEKPTTSYDPSQLQKYMEDDISDTDAAVEQEVVYDYPYAEIDEFPNNWKGKAPAPIVKKAKYLKRGLPKNPDEYYLSQINPTAEEESTHAWDIDHFIHFEEYSPFASPEKQLSKVRALSPDITNCDLDNFAKEIFNPDEDTLSEGGWSPLQSKKLPDNKFVNYDDEPSQLNDLNVDSCLKGEENESLFPKRSPSNVTDSNPKKTKFEGDNASACEEERMLTNQKV